MSKVYAVTDLHGYLNLYQKIKNHIAPEDKVYFLGDAIDRGPESLLLAETILKDPQFIYLKGNHEDILVKAIKEYYEEGKTDWVFDVYCNGGKDTWNSIIERGEDFAMNFANILQNLPLYATYTNKSAKEIILSHSGFTPKENNAHNYLSNREHIAEDWPQGYENLYIVHGHTPVLLYQNATPMFYADGHKINIDMGTHNPKAQLNLKNCKKKDIIYM